MASEIERREWMWHSFIGNLVLSREKKGSASIKGIDNPDLRAAFDFGWVCGAGDAARELCGEDASGPCPAEVSDDP